VPSSGVPVIDLLALQIDDNFTQGKRLLRQQPTLAVAPKKRQRRSALLWRQRLLRDRLSQTRGEFEFYAKTRNVVMGNSRAEKVPGPAHDVLSLCVVVLHARRSPSRRELAAAPL
jgi:hypothetical protein